MEVERAAAAKADGELKSAIGGYLEYGGDASVVPSIKSVQQAKYLEGQMRKESRAGTGKSGISADERRLKNILDARDNQLKRYEKKVEEGELEPTDAKYLAAADAWEKANEAYVGMNQAGGVPVATQQGSGRALGETGIPVRPKEQAVVQSAPIPLTPEGQIDIDKIPFAEIDKTIEKVNEQAKAQEEAAKVWNTAQMDLEKKLEKLYPGNIGNTNYAKLARFAKAVLNGERISDPKASGAVDETGAPLTKSVAESALEELGFPFAGEAFVEPGKARKSLFGLVGDQRVPYNQLLETWAKNYLQRAPTTVVPQVKAIPAEKAQKADEFLNSFQK